jgi:F5/8 type C domain
MLDGRRIEMASDTSGIRKRQLEAGPASGVVSAGEIDIARCATLAYSSENPAHPVDHLVDGRCGRGGTRWVSARPDVTEQILVEFDQPQLISRLLYEVEEAGQARTQEVRAELSGDGGRTYSQVFVQEYTFSPAGATYQHEEQRFEAMVVSHLRLTIVPDKNGSGAASLTTLRLFA